MCVQCVAVSLSQLGDGAVSESPADCVVCNLVKGGQGDKTRLSARGKGGRWAGKTDVRASNFKNQEFDTCVVQAQ